MAEMLYVAAHSHDIYLQVINDIHDILYAVMKSYCVSEITPGPPIHNVYFHIMCIANTF